MNRQRKIELLNKHPILVNLDQSTLEKFAEEAEAIELDAGQSIVEPTDELDGFYVVDHGELESTVERGPDDNRIHDVYRRNESFGDLALVTDAPSCCEISAVLDSRILKLPRDVLVDEIRNNPALNQQMTRKVEAFFRDERERISTGSGTIISIGSAESSVGKSLLGINLTAVIEDRTGGDVCLIDFTERPAGNIEEKVVQEPTFEIDQLERESYPGDYPVFSIDFPEEVPEGSIRAFLNTLTESYEYTVVILPEGYGNILRRVYERSDRMLFLTKDTEEAFLSTEMFMDQLQEDLNLSSIPVEVVLNQSDEAGRTQRRAAEERLGVSVKAQLPTIQDKNYVENFESRPPYVLERPSKPYSRNIRRIAHRVCGVSLGIALGSGAARGLAHIGVLEVLEEENIQPDMVAGSSMGALVGAGYALGHSPKRMRRFAREFEEMGGFFRLTDLSIPPSQSILRLSRIRNFLEDLYGDATFEDTEIPLVITASSINSAQRRAITEGRLVDAILASIAIPMIYPPQTSNGSTWVDGGVFEPVPVESLQEEGMDRVVAVNTIPPQGVLGEQQPERLGPGPEKRQIPSLIKKFVPIGSGNIIDVGMRTIEAIEARLAEDSTKQADVVVDPYLPEMSWFDFDQYEKFIEQGRRSARENIDKIRSLSPRSSDRHNAPDYQS